MWVYPRAGDILCMFFFPFSCFSRLFLLHPMLGMHLLENISLYDKENKNQCLVNLFPFKGVQIHSLYTYDHKVLFIYFMFIYFVNKFAKNGCRVTRIIRSPVLKTLLDLKNRKISHWAVSRDLLLTRLFMRIDSIFLWFLSFNMKNFPSRCPVYMAKRESDRECPHPSGLCAVL